jgi:hypothetical protein
LFLLPFYEANALSSGDDHCVCFHRSNVSPMQYWNSSIMNYKFRI